MSTVPLQVTFRDMEPSESIEAAIREKLDKLGQFGRIERCRVMVECPHNHHHQNGAEYHVRIELFVPGSELVVAHQGQNDGSHADVNVALRDAFRAARRELESYTHKRRGQVKRHSL